MLRISRPTMYRLAAAELVPAHKVGGSIRFDERELAEWLYGDEAAGGVSSSSQPSVSPVERRGPEEASPAVEPRQPTGL